MIRTGVCGLTAASRIFRKTVLRSVHDLLTQYELT